MGLWSDSMSGFSKRPKVRIHTFEIPKKRLQGHEYGPLHQPFKESLDYDLHVGPMKGGLSVGCRLKILHNVQHRLGNETVSVRLKWSVKCRVTNSECRCRATLILG